MFTTIENLKTLMKMCMCSYQDYPTGLGAGADDADTNKMEAAISDSQLSKAELEELKGAHTVEEIWEFFANTDKLINVDDDALNAYMECINAYYAGQTEAFDTSTTDRSNLGGDIEAASATTEYALDTQTDWEGGAVEVVPAEDGAPKFGDKYTVNNGHYVIGDVYYPVADFDNGAWPELLAEAEAPAVDVNLGTIQDGATVDQGSYGSTGNIDTVVASEPKFGDRYMVTNGHYEIGWVLYPVADFDNGAWPELFASATAPVTGADVNLRTVEGGVVVDQGNYGTTGTVETRAGDNEMTGVGCYIDGVYTDLSYAKYKEVYGVDYRDVQAQEQIAAEHRLQRPVEAFPQWWATTWAERVSLVRNRMQQTSVDAKEFVNSLKILAELNNGEIKQIASEAATGISLKEIGERVLWVDTPADNVSVSKQKEALIESRRGAYNKGMRKLIERGTSAVQPSNDPENRESNGLSDFLYRNKDTVEVVQAILTHIMYIYPFDVGTEDVFMDFIQRAEPGIRMDDARAFATWFDGGMVGEFNPNVKVNTGVGLLKSVTALQGAIGNLSPEDAAHIQAWEYQQVSSDVRDMITAYIQYRLVPDLKVMNNTGYRGLFGLEILVDDKHTTVDSYIADLEAALKNGDISNSFMIAEKALVVISQQDQEGWATFLNIWAGQHTGYIESAVSRNTHVGEIAKYQEKTADYAAIKAMNDAIGNKISVLQGFRSINEMTYAFGLSDYTLQDPNYKLTPNNVEAFLASSPRPGYPTFGEALDAINGTSGGLSDFKERLRDLEGTTYSNNGPAGQTRMWNMITTPFGGDISNVPSHQVLAAMESRQSYRADRNPLHTFLRRLETSGYHNFTYADIRTWIENGAWINISKLPDTWLRLTSNAYDTASGNTDHVITKEQLTAGAGGFNEVFQFSMIKKGITKITPEGDILEYDIQYTGHIKPHCSNPVDLRISEAICTKRTAKILERSWYDMSTKISREGMIGVKVPNPIWATLIPGGGGLDGGNILTTPGNGTGTLVGGGWSGGNVPVRAVRAVIGG